MFYYGNFEYGKDNRNTRIYINYPYNNILNRPGIDLS